MLVSRKENGDVIAFVNGDAAVFPPAFLIAELLAERGLAGKRVAVERNGEIVPRSKHTEIQLIDGDRIEIVVAVGGG